MSDDIRTKIGRILRAVAIRSADEFTFGGEIFSARSAGMAGSVSFSQVPLISVLQQQLYQQCFCSPFNGAPLAPEPAPDGLVEQLSAANTTKARWEAGWQVNRVGESGQIVAQRFGLTRTFWPGEFVTYEGPGMAPRPGASVSVLFAKDSLNMQPGFYFAFGETAGDQEDDAGLVRFYWNARIGAMPLLIGLHTPAFNRYQIPFRLKCVTSQTPFRRLEAAVLYVNKKYARIAAELVCEIAGPLAKHLGPETPLFTWRLAPGLSFAEDPGNGESFGMNRCRILAEGIWNARDHPPESVDARFEEVRRHFAECGVDLDRPHLNSAAISYDFPFFRGEYG